MVDGGISHDCRPSGSFVGSLQVETDWRGCGVSSAQFRRLHTDAYVEGGRDQVSVLEPVASIFVGCRLRSPEEGTSAK
jgi:hypothetical protein